jgi:hypothetical protein
MNGGFFESNFERIEGDFYPTVDTRTVDGLLANVRLDGCIVDPCAPDGSGIVDYLKQRGHDAHCVSDAFSDFQADWIVTNPPYKRGEVDRIIYAQIERVRRREVIGCAFLLRSIFDFAKGRQPMFTDPLYSGKIHLCFRVFWSDARDMEPKHNYVWHVWAPGIKLPPSYYYAPYDPRYAVKRKP